jgi:1-acyl-sn-glycerol-3-phosphate acyltransferase
MDIYYNSAKLIIRIFHFIFSQDCHVSGELNSPPGAKIIAGNHPNATDGLFLPFVFRENLHFFVQGDIFDIPFVGWLLARSGQIPVHPERKNAAMEQAAMLLAQGKTVAIFPEACLNPDHRLVKARTGAVRLSLFTGAPIIPVGFYVPKEHLRKIIRQKNGHLSQGRWQTGGHCYLHIGYPWLPGEEIGEKVDDTALHELTARMMEKIEVLAEMAHQDSLKEYRLLLPGITHNG